MYVEALSLLTALCYGVSAILNLKGMRDSNPLTGTMTTTLVQVTILIGLVLARPPENMNWTGVAFFVVSGILASTLGRFLNFTSIERLGVAVSATIIGSSPLFSTVFAVLFIGEGVSPSTLVGTFLIVVGVALARGGDRGGSVLTSAFLLPLASAAFYGASSVVRKVGLNLLPEATFGALIGSAASLVSFIVYVALFHENRIFRLSGSSAKFFAASGIVVSLAWISMYSAFSAGDVSVVSALIGSNPLFSIILSTLFLRDSEELGWRVAAGCLVIVAGASVITLF